MGYRSIGVVTTLVLVLFLGGNVENAFPIHNSEEIIWQLVLVSSYPACSNYHYQIMNKYDEITEKYLDLYQLENYQYKPTCMTELKYAEYESPDDLDLLIVVYDRNKGRAQLHPHDLGGFYSHLGDEWTHNHTIIFCDCSNFNYSDPVWILSHELSHFILNYLDFDLAVAEEQIHTLDKKYDYCVEEVYDGSCSSVKTTIKGSSSDWVVMKPYQPAIGKKIITNSTDPTFFNSQFKREMFAEITSWWLEGDISDEKYAKSLELLTGETNIKDRIGGFFSKESSYLILADPPKNNKIDFSDMEMVEKWINEKAEKVLYMIPDVQEYQWNSFEEKNEVDFNGNITDSDFVSGMKYLTQP